MLGKCVKYCKDHGIVQQFTVPDTLQQNDLVKSKYKTLVECAQSMIKGKNLSNDCGAYAIKLFI